MANSSDTIPRLRFLAKAAQTYALAAPSTSAHLNMEHQGIAALQNTRKISAKKSNENTCPACGHILLPGWTSQTQINSSSSARTGTKPHTSKQHRERRNPAHKPTQEKALVTECLHCRRKMRTPLPERPRFSSHPIKPSVPASARVASDAPKNASINASAKNRAKARKERGLRALLAKSKSDASERASELDLDLMDLMKKA